MDKFYSALRSFTRLDFRIRQDNDWIDRLNSTYTSIIFVICGIIISTKQYAGDPIKCWSPNHFTDRQADYVNDICWVSNTYYQALDDYIPKEIERRQQREITYYQWVPFCLILQAIIHYLPCMAWQSLNGRSGIKLKVIVSAAVDVGNLNPETRAKTVSYLSRYLDSCLSNQREYRGGVFVRIRHFMARYFCLFCGRRYGNYLSCLYMFVKLLALAMDIGQLAFLTIFVQTNYRFYGVSIMTDLLRGHDWQESGRFPRVTLCDLLVRQVGNVHRHTVQCVLSINMLNEKIFIFLWFWLVGVGVLAVFNVLHWANRILLAASRRHFVRKYLRVIQRFPPKTDTEAMKLLKRFTDGYLRHDGLLALRLVCHNAGDLVVAEIVASLWSQFVTRCRQNSAARGADSIDAMAAFATPGALWSGSNTPQNQSADQQIYDVAKNPPRRLRQPSLFGDAFRAVADEDARVDPDIPMADLTIPIEKPVDTMPPVAKDAPDADQVAPPAVRWADAPRTAVRRAPRALPGAPGRPKPPAAPPSSIP